MNNKSHLKLKGDHMKEMIQKFNSRQYQASLEEALVYLKLRQYKCQNSKALTFAKRKQRCIDGTKNIDGPAGYKKLQVIKPQSKLTNGWLRGQKLKYAGTTGYTDFLTKNQSSQKKQITRYNKISRLMQEQSRKLRSKSVITLDISKPRESLQRIGIIKEDMSKQRENRNLYIEFEGVKLDQTTKNFYKDADSLNEEGLIVKLAAFQPLISDKSVVIKVDQQNLKGKTLTNYQLQGSRKRQNIISYQSILSKISEKSSSKSQNCKNIIQTKKQNGEKHFSFGLKTLDAASNPLIMMNTKKLEKDLQLNQKKCGENLVQYENFYKNIQKAMKYEFLDRKFSITDINYNKRHSIN